MFFENYVKEPLRYGFSDTSKLIKGGLFYGIGLFLMYAALFLMSYPFLSSSFSLEDVFYFTDTALIFTSGVLIFICSIAFFVFLNGYFLNIIKNSLENSKELPEWADYNTMIKKGFVFTSGLIIIAIIFTILQQIINFSFGFYDYLDYVLIVLSIILSLIQSLYMMLAAINYADLNKFSAFFDVKKILKLITLEYLAVFIVVSIISSLIVIIPVLAVVVLVTVVGMFALTAIGGYITNEAIAVAFLVVVPLLILLSIVFFYSGVYTYRSFTNYFNSKIKNI